LLAALSEVLTKKADQNLERNWPCPIRGFHKRCT
jgi:hypothetical protein